MKNGSFAASIDGFADIAADTVLVQYTDATTTVDADTDIEIGAVTYTFEEAIAANTVAFAVTGFEANVADFVSLSGDVGFRKVDSEIVAAGNDVTASLYDCEASVALEGAEFGLLLSDGSTAFEMRNGSFAASIDGLADITADSVRIQYTDASTTVAADTGIEIGAVTYTFEDAIAADTVAFEVTGFEANVANFVSLSGDLGFRKTGGDIVAVGNSVSASLDAGSVFVRLTEADFGLVVGEAVPYRAQERQLRAGRRPRGCFRGRGHRSVHEPHDGRGRWHDDQCARPVHVRERDRGRYGGLRGHRLRGERGGLRLAG